MTRRFSQMLMTFLFPSKTQSNQDFQQTTNNNRSSKLSLKQTRANSFKRRARSTDVRI